MINKLLTTILIILVVAIHSKAQLDNSAFYTSRDFHPEKVRQLSLNTDILLFTKDNEYFNKIADGFTLYGFQLTPYLTYFPSENIRLDLGIYTQKDFGNSDYSQVSPFITAMFKWGPIKQIIGNLDGSLNHGLIEPLYDFERGLIDRQETGMQTLINSDKLFFDLWVNWETMIYKGDNNQEEVSGGISTDYNINEGPHQFKVPVQLVLYHRGGQFDASPAPIATLQNSAIGLKYAYSFPDASMISKMSVNGYYVYFKDWSPQKDQMAFKDGDGFYINLALSTVFDLDLMASYWVGREFIAIKGGQLYPSVSSTFKFPDFVEPQREILIFRLLHDLHLSEDLIWTTRIEPYYHFESRKWEFSFGFYLNFSSDVFISSLSKQNMKR